MPDLAEGADLDLVLALLELPDRTLLAGGPGGIARRAYASAWQRVDTPIRAVAAFARGGSLVLAGGIDGIARSTDDGRTWQPVRLEGGPRPIAALAVVPGTDTPDGATAEAKAAVAVAVAGTLGDGILRSTDDGRTWQSANFGLPGLDVTAVLAVGSTIVAGTAAGICTSTNAGRAWRVSSGSTGKPVAGLTIAPAPGGPDDAELLAVTENGEVLRSPDAGRSWRYALTLPARAVPVALAATLGGDPIVATAEDGVLRYQQGGSGSPARIDLTAYALLRTGDSRTGDSRTGSGSGDGGGDGGVLAGGPTGLHLSLDDGRAWRRLDSPALDDLEHTVELPNAGGTLRWGRLSGIVGAEGRLPGVPTPLSAVAVAPDGALLVSSAAGLARSVDRGRTWASIVPGEPGCVHHVAFRDDHTGWAGDANGSRLLRTEDAGRTWRPVPVPWAPAGLGSLICEGGGFLALAHDPGRDLMTVWRCETAEVWAYAGTVG